jgi:hypothetical protein
VLKVVLGEGLGAKETKRWFLDVWVQHRLGSAVTEKVSLAGSADRNVTVRVL